jgi:hypothetical protein
MMAEAMGIWASDAHRGEKLIRRAFPLRVLCSAVLEARSNFAQAGESLVR